MARQTLVTQLKQLIEDLTIRKGPFAVAMLLRDSGGSGRYWTFLSSAPWLDEVGLYGPAILAMIEELERGLGIGRYRKPESHFLRRAAAG
ncbi:hypothetical protein HYR99_13455 [Candidatus Poribacteria bacterium]|nr:hypothetical protein [Candidatus Poribacteria bacterium]